MSELCIGSQLTTISHIYSAEVRDLSGTAFQPKPQAIMSSADIQLLLIRLLILASLHVNRKAHLDTNIIINTDEE